jgi:hypothetical protein
VTTAHLSHGMGAHGPGQWPECGLAGRALGREVARASWKGAREGWRKLDLGIHSMPRRRLGVNCCSIQNEGEREEG